MPLSQRGHFLPKAALANCLSLTRIARKILSVKLYLSGPRCLPPWQPPLSPAEPLCALGPSSPHPLTPSSAFRSQGRETQKGEFTTASGSLGTVREVNLQVFQQLSPRVMLGGNRRQGTGAQIATWITAFFFFPQDSEAKGGRILYVAKIKYPEQEALALPSGTFCS